MILRRPCVECTSRPFLTATDPIPCAWPHLHSLRPPSVKRCHPAVAYVLLYLPPSSSSKLHSLHLSRTTESLLFSFIHYSFVCEVFCNPRPLMLPSSLLEPPQHTTKRSFIYHCTALFLSSMKPYSNHVIK